MRQMEKELRDLKDKGNRSDVRNKKKSQGAKKFQLTFYLLFSYNKATPF